MNPNKLDQKLDELEQDGRFQRLKNRVVNAGDRIDLRGRITRHPLPAIGIAFALGAIAGLVRGRSAAPRLRIGRAIFVTAGAAALRLAREAALWQVGDAARRWLDTQGTAQRTGTSTTPTPAKSSRMADVEPFLEH